MSFTRIFGCCALIFLGMGDSQFLRAELLVYDFLPNSELRFQIQNAVKDVEYRLEISDLERRIVHKEISSFSAGALPDVRSALIQCDLEAGVYALRLYREGDIVFESPQSLSQSGKQWSDAVDLDRREMDVKWSVSRPCLVRVNVAMNSGILVDTVSDWHISGEGNFRSRWSIKDGSIEHGHFYALSPSLYTYATYIPLKGDFLVVGRVALGDIDGSLSVEGFQLPQDTFSFDLKIEAQKAEGVYQVSSGTPVRVELSSESKKLLAGKRYEILLYLDGEFIHEESQALDPYTYILPQIPWAGEHHYLSVNVLDYEGNFGIRTAKLKFK